jgi:hypothetical protein
MAPVSEVWGNPTLVRARPPVAILSGPGWPGMGLPEPVCADPVRSWVRYVPTEGSAGSSWRGRGASAQPCVGHQKGGILLQSENDACSMAYRSDLPLAWRRTKVDIQANRVFVRTPYEVELVDQNTDEWLAQLNEKVVAGYRPVSAIIADIPKGNGAVRPGAVLSLEDRTVYADLIGSMFPQISAGLRWSQGSVDFSYQLSERSDRVNWFSNRFAGWSQFRQKQLEKFQKDEKVTHVVVTDLTGFYENIDLPTLLSDLRELGSDANAVQQLSTCLYRWAVIPGRGIPQGYSPSDILAKVYLNPVDRALMEEGFDYIRYVDDMRLFCTGFAKCKESLLFLTQALRRRGLNLQTSKTEMLGRDAAKTRIEGIAPVIEAEQKRYRKEIEEIVGAVDPYAPIAEIEVQIDPDDAPLEILRNVFSEHFLSDRPRFNTSLFHYILKRFGAQKDPTALEFCLNQLYIRPQETQPILDYIRMIGEPDQIYPTVIKFLNSDDDIYEYQKYQLFRWLGERSIPPPPRLLAIARQLTFDLSRPPYLRAVCRRLLQEHGSVGDRERLEQSYGHAHDDLEAAQILISLKNMEAGRRNAFYGRVEGDGLLRARAARLVRQNLL